MTQPAYFTILARNYLPAALALSESLREHGDGTPLTIFLTDVTAETELPETPGVRWMHPGMLDLDERTMLALAMSYDLVEFATAVKPLVFQSLLGGHEQVAYLDPDTYVVSPMEELGPALSDSAGGIVLTPHYLEPVPEGSPFSEGHLLYAGVYNLGFCAVDRRAAKFLDWWWGHLRTECLHDPLSGLFVDQKWVDLGSVYFDGSALRHRGYNVGMANIHERPIGRDSDGNYTAGPDPLRLFHFHAFDPRRPDELTTRIRTSALDAFKLSDSDAEMEPLTTLCREYAAVVLSKEAEIGPQPDYVYGTDTSGRRITSRMRRAYRAAALAEPGSVPSPFIPAEAAQYEQWRRRALPAAGRLMVSEVAKGVRVALLEEYDGFKRRAPKLTSSLRSRFIKKGGMWD